MMLTCRAARLFSLTTSPSSRSAVATNSNRPDSSGVKGNSTVSTAASRRTDFSPTKISSRAASAASPESARAVTRTVVVCPARPLCRSLTRTLLRSAFFIFGSVCRSTARSIASVAPTPTA